jgi:hypothetical protein
MAQKGSSMSHIPSSAMKHAGPVHHDDHHGDKAPAKPPKSDKAAKSQSGGLGTGAWLAIGGTILAGAAAAIAVPLLRGDKPPVATRHGKKANTGKAARKKAAKPAQD